MALQIEFSEGESTIMHGTQSSNTCDQYPENIQIVLNKMNTYFSNPVNGKYIYKIGDELVASNDPLFTDLCLKSLEFIIQGAEYLEFESLEYTLISMGIANDNFQLEPLILIHSLAKLMNLIFDKENKYPQSLNMAFLISRKSRTDIIHSNDWDIRNPFDINNLSTHIDLDNIDMQLHRIALACPYPFNNLVDLKYFRYFYY